jgi:hypothetical protein
VIARVFPAHRDFVTWVQAEGIERSFPAEPYTKDKLSYEGTGLVEYETPAQTEGLGTFAGLKKDAGPIRGLATPIVQCAASSSTIFIS